MKIQEIKKVLKKGEIQKILNDENLSKSAKIKIFFEAGLNVKEIANILNIRYNFAYNVISNYVNVENIPTIQNKEKSKKDQIIEMFLNGQTNKEISINLKTNYNYVFNTLKEYKSKQNSELSDNSK